MAFTITTRMFFQTGLSKSFHLPISIGQTQSQIKLFLEKSFFKLVTLFYVIIKNK